METLVFTTFFDNHNREGYSELLFEWLISLRTNANYKGEILIINYGMREETISKLNLLRETDIGYDIRVVEVDNPAIRGGSYLSNWRNIDSIPILEEYEGYYIVHTGADVWFQNDINSLWEEIEKTEGCYFAIERGRSCRYRGPEDQHEEYEKTQKKLHGFVFGDFMSGKQESYVERLKLYKHLFETSWKGTEESQDQWGIQTWGTDQSMMTHTFDFDKDRLNALSYAASEYYLYDKDGELIFWRDTINTEADGLTDVIGIHVLAHKLTREERMEGSRGIPFESCRFYKRYSEIWDKYYLSL
tara:strand:- start:466 stop:1371 length:906 start_codon:yes stop_codon:yes gene_type:complete